MSERVEVVRGIYAAWARGDFAAGKSHLDDDLEFVVRPPFPEAGAARGTEEVGKYMRRFLAQWERYTVEAERFQEVGDTVLVHVHQRGKGKTSGVEIETRTFQLFTFRDRKIVRIESIVEEREALEAAGLPAPR